MPKRVREGARWALSRVSARKFRTRIDLHGSNIPLHAGAQALASEVARRLGLASSQSTPHVIQQGGPHLQHWHGRFAQPDGDMAQLTVLHASDLPVRTGRNTQYINLAATILSTFEFHETRTIERGHV